MFAIRIHSNHDTRLLAACDEELLGQTYRENSMRITVSDAFYNAEVVSEEVLIERMRSVAIMNLVGEKTVSVAIKEGYVSKDCVIVIDGVKHAQVVR
ncbi:MAG: DUF424 family protein [Candidatus Methanomethylophilaceae archaeon]|jgi:hypothetical protein